MEIWRKFQIAAGVCAVVAVALTIATLNIHNLVYWTMWAWTITLWFLLFLWPMPVIERNKKNHRIAMALFFQLAVLVAVGVNTWLQGEWPATHGFSRAMLVYTAAYFVVALVFAAWLKIKEKKNK